MVQPLTIHFSNPSPWLQWAYHDVMLTAFQLLSDLQINDVNLLVCDECHRAVKRDPYNCIMQEFYHDASNTVGLAQTCCKCLWLGTGIVIIRYPSFVN